MPAVLVDANVLLDVLTNDPEWGPWSYDAMVEAADSHELCINAIVYAEVSVGFETLEEVDAAIPVASFSRMSIPDEAAFLAGKCFRRYRQRGGQKRSPLPDFFIGAHAAVAGMALLTRDSSRYRTYFPSLRLISPE